MKSGIYKIVNLVNDKVYVGSAVNAENRWYKHKSRLRLNKHHSIKLQNSWNKYGFNNFKFEIIEECNQEKLIEREQYYIDSYDSYNNGYNCNPMAGSSLGRKCSYETKIKIGKANTGNKNRLGKKHSKNTIEKLKKKSEGNKNCLGRVLSKETKEKIGKANTGNKNCLGRILSEKTKEKISKSHIGKMTGRDNVSYNPTPVLQYDLEGNFIKEWRDLISLKEAGFNNRSISNNTNGRSKSSHGFVWKFKTTI